jgi:hypothetical protein
VQTKGLRPTISSSTWRVAEFDVLIGGESALRNTLMMEVEVEFGPLRVNQPLFGEATPTYASADGLCLGFVGSIGDAMLGSTLPGAATADGSPKPMRSTATTA